MWEESKTIRQRVLAPNLVELKPWAQLKIGKIFSGIYGRCHAHCHREVKSKRLTTKALSLISHFFQALPGHSFDANTATAWP